MSKNGNSHIATHHKHNQFVYIPSSPLILLVFVCQTSLTPLPHSSVPNSLSDEAHLGKLSETQKGQERHEEPSKSSRIQLAFLWSLFAQIIMSLKLFMLTLVTFVSCNIPQLCTHFISSPILHLLPSSSMLIPFTLLYIFQHQVSTNRGELGMDSLYKTESIISLCMHNVGLDVPQVSLLTFLSFLYLFLLAPLLKHLLFSTNELRSIAM